LSAYADTSFLASLHVLDGSSTLAAARMKRAKLLLLIAPFGELQLTNAVALRLSRKELSASQVKAAHALIRKDLEDGVLMVNALPASVFERAKQIARRQTSHWGARTRDVLHVASALALQVDTFYTFDTRPAKLAAAEGRLFADPGPLNRGSIWNQERWCVGRLSRMKKRCRNACLGLQPLVAAFEDKGVVV
jgi:predicted nucleic acid-binding protein